MRELPHSQLTQRPRHGTVQGTVHVCTCMSSRYAWEFLKSTSLKNMWLPKTYFCFCFFFCVAPSDLVSIGLLLLLLLLLGLFCLRLLASRRWLALACSCLQLHKARILLQIAMGIVNGSECSCSAGCYGEFGPGTSLQPGPPQSHQTCSLHDS